MTQGGKSVTLKHIASRLGISISTVSRALGGYEDISGETRELVARTARQMNYRPNRNAQSLVSNAKSIQNIVILGVPNVLKSIAFNSYYGEIMRAFCDGVDTTTHRFILAAEDGSNADYVDYHKLLRDHQATAAVVLDLAEDDERVRKLTRAGIPLVVLGEYEPANKLQCAVWTDNVRGAYLATRHLILRGRRRIGLVAGLRGQKVSASRLQGYRIALAESEMPFDESLVVNPQETDEFGGYSAMLELLHRGCALDAIFCASDLRSIGVIKALREHGLSVPGDVSVVGYDDLPIASFFHPQLTTIRQPTYKVGAFAIRNLERLTRGETVTVRTKVFAPELVVRASA